MSYGKTKRKFPVLKPSKWTNIINDTFLNNYYVLCTVVYKHCRVNIVVERSKHYLQFEGKCKDCQSKLVGWAEKKPMEGFPLIITIVTQDTRNNWPEHMSKRPLNGKKRYDIGKELLNSGASNWQRNAVSSIDFGDKLPPNIYNKTVLRKCKQEFKDDVLGINEKCPIKSLIELKHGKFSGQIHMVSADKLFVHYWTPYQLVVYKHLQKSYCRLAIDATGSLVKKIVRTKQNIKSGHIFLYEAVVSNPQYQVPVTQMLSEKRTH